MNKPRKEITLRVGDVYPLGPGITLRVLAPRPGRDDGARLGIRAPRSVVVRRPEQGEWRPGRKGGAA